MPGAWVDLDLSTAVFHAVGGTPYGQYTAGAVTSLSFNGPDYFFPGLTLNDVDTYEFEFTVSDDFGVSATLTRAADESDAAWAGSTYWLKDGYDPSTVLTLTVGPGVEEWDLAVAAGYDAVNFNNGNANHVTAIRYRNMTEIVAAPYVLDRGDRVDIECVAASSWEPPVVPRPSTVSLGESRVVARRITDTDTASTGFPLIVEDTASTARLRERILFGGKDITYWRGVPTPIPATRRVQPLSFGSGGPLLLPQSNYYEVPGEGDLSWLKMGKKVVIQLVDEDDVIVVPDYWIGYAPLPPYPTAEGYWAIDLAGDATGRLSQIKVPSPRFRKNRDVLIRCANDLTTVGRRVSPRFPGSGIEVASRGGMSGLDHFNEHMTLAQTNSGEQWTCRWDRLLNAYTFVEKDATTIDATVYFDSSLVTPDLLPSPVVNRVWATGVTQAGERITFTAAPGVIQGTAPDFPGTLTEGDSGADVTVLLWQLTFTGYLDLDDHPGGFDQDVVDAVEELQEDAGLTVTGVVNSATWDALWDLTSTKKGVNYIHEVPAAARSYTEKWLRSATGAIIGRNPNYDPHRDKWDADYDMGRVPNRRKLKRWARNELTPNNEIHWAGTIRFESGLIRGEHNPGDPLTSADVMDARELTEGMNLWAPTFMGGTLLPVVYVERTGSTVTAMVDTRDQDTMKAWEIHQRNLDSRHNPAHAVSGRVRQSEINNDVTTEWVDFCGKLTRAIDLTAGWSEPIPIFSGQEGFLQRIRTEVDVAREFAMTVTSKPGYTGRWDSLIPDPLADPGDAPPWFEQDGPRDFLESKGLVYAAGTFDEPCGYGYARHTDNKGDVTAVPLKGIHVDDGGASYRTLAEPVLYLRLFVAGGSTTLQRGRIFRQQLDSSGT